MISNPMRIVGGEGVYNGRNSKLLFLGILEELKNIIPNDDARLPAKNAGSHIEDESVRKTGGVIKSNLKQ